ncbi:MAG: FAD-dependent monooxygenase, partial [Rhodoplanes sp.]
MTEERTDILIGGGGFAGLALAVALRQALGPLFSVTVADPSLARPPIDARASAIAAAARRLLETIGVWQAVAAEAQDIVDMVVTDSRLDDAVRPVFLTFGGDVEPGEPFAQMIENGPLLAALVSKAKDDGVVLAETSVVGFEAGPEQVTAALGDGRTLAARLLVAADGARSKIREQAGIGTNGWSYGQSGIVTTVAHERDHQGRA